MQQQSQHQASQDLFGGLTGVQVFFLALILPGGLPVLFAALIALGIQKLVQPHATGDPDSPPAAS